MGLLIFYFLLANIVSFICSLLEAVILSTSHAYIGLIQKEGKKSGELLGRLKDNIDRPLAAILSLNTIAHTIGAAGVGSQATAVFGSSGLGIASAVLTFAILVFSEIIPKTLGAVYWKKLAPGAAYSIQFLIFLTYPFVLLSEVIAGLMKTNQQEDAGNVSREEMIVTAEMSANDGSIQKREGTIIKNLLMLDNIFVSDVMTPRSVFLAFEADITVDEVMNKYRPIRYSRIPIFEDNLDQIIGMVHRYRLLEASSNDDHDRKIREFVTPLHTVPEDISVGAVLDQFIKRKEHLFLVVDEYGVVSGLVSLEDAIETLLGVEIVDEFDSVEDLRVYALEQWKMRKRMLKQQTTGAK